MSRLRVAVLTHEDLVPPESREGLDAKELQRTKTEYDVVHAVDALGHERRVVGVSWDLLPIRRVVEEWKPHVVFNLLMEFRDVGVFQAHVAGYLELLGAHYSGCNPRGIMLSRDKVLSKKILRFHRIPTPAFAVYRPGREVRPRRWLAFPQIVKSVDEEASLGIAQASVVRDADQLRARVAFIHDHVGSDALVEEYIHGRELTVSVLGNARLQTFPVWEMVFENLPDGSVPIATERAKWDLAYQKRVGIDTRAARGLSAERRSRIAALARRVYRALGLSGYARVDLRLADDGRVFVIEANATPDIANDEDFASSAAATGIAYPALIQRVLNLGRRYRPPYKRGAPAAPSGT
ncbi:MAG: ATP-grasp domain-containing protein [Deltaproteobacteria bacterium]|nr:MAG: ATP-grasp domain-containing protein [Deltaproteobacteria bacterium]